MHTFDQVASVLDSDLVAEFSNPGHQRRKTALGRSLHPCLTGSEVDRGMIHPRNLLQALLHSAGASGTRHPLDGEMKDGGP